MSASEKIVAYVDGQRTPVSTDCYAVPGDDYIIDYINPATGLTVYYAKNLEQVQAEHPGAVLMTVDEFCEAKAIRQHSPITWQPVTEDQYYEMLEVLPPAYMGNGVFLVGEAWDYDASNGHSRYAAYRRRGEVFETASRPMTIREFHSM